MVLFNLIFLFPSLIMIVTLFGISDYHFFLKFFHLFLFSRFYDVFRLPLHEWYAKLTLYDTFFDQSFTKVLRFFWCLLASNYFECFAFVSWIKQRVYNDKYLSLFLIFLFFCHSIFWYFGINYLFQVNFDTYMVWMNEYWNE